MAHVGAIFFIRKNGNWQLDESIAHLKFPVTEAMDEYPAVFERFQKRNTEANFLTPIYGWRYDTTTDKMRNLSKYFATIRSKNQIEFTSPYDGGSRIEIALRKKLSKMDIMLSVDNGQFHTGLYSTSIAAKFDDSPVMDFSASESDDHSSNLLFINQTSKFYELLKKSKSLIIEAPFYQEGRKQFEFNIANLNFNP